MTGDRRSVDRGRRGESGGAGGVGGRPWRISPLLLASAALHVGGLASVLVAPRTARTVAKLWVANHAVLAAVGLRPSSQAYGPNLDRLDRVRRLDPRDGVPSGTRNGVREGSGPADRDPEPPRVALTFDDGPDPDITPAVLDLLDRFGARASFFCVGERVARNPDLTREIVARGHRVENHTQTHPWYFAMLPPRGMVREIDRAQEVIGTVTGRRPRLFRPPAGLRNPLLEPVLARRGLWLTSWTRRAYDTVERDARTVLHRLSRGVGPDEILLMHDARPASAWRLRPPGHPLILDVLPLLLARLERAGLRSVPVEAPAVQGADGAGCGGGHPDAREQGRIGRP